MNIKDLVAVSGLSGLYRMAGNRSNGLIIEDLETGKRKFAASRKHQFTPLESIGIYIDSDETVDIKKVFQNMRDQMEDNPPIAPSSSSTELREYFLDILPDHDQDRVKIGDIKKLIRWFVILDKKGFLDQEEEPETADEEVSEEETTD